MLGETVELDAKSAARHRVLGVAGHVDQLAVLDVIEESTCIGTVVRARTAHDAITCVYGHGGLLCSDQRSKLKPSDTMVRPPVRRVEPIRISKKEIEGRK